PPDAKEPARRSRSNRREKGGVIPPGERLSASFCEAAPRTGHHKPRRRAVVVLANDEVCREILRRPRLEKRWSFGAELVHEVAQPFAFDGVEDRVSHWQSSSYSPS